MTHVSVCSWLGTVLFTETRGSKTGNDVEGHEFNGGDVELQS